MKRKTAIMNRLQEIEFELNDLRKDLSDKFISKSEAYTQIIQINNEKEELEAILPFAKDNE